MDRPEPFLVVALVSLVLYSFYITRRSPIPKGRKPPIIDISPEDIFTRPREAYGDALATHGPVIGVRRRGQLEYIVGQEFARYVLTCDRLFSFEKGSAAILNLQPIMWFTNGMLFRDMQDVVRDAIIERMDEIVQRIYPLFQRDAKDFAELAADGLKDGKHPSCFSHFHNTIAETTLLLLLGKEYVNETNLGIVEDVSNDMAELTGQYQNFSPIGRVFPALWAVYTWIKVMFITIPCGFLRKCGPAVWRDISRYEELIASGDLAPEDEPRTLLFFMTKMFLPKGARRISVFHRLYIIILLLCFIFAAVHTTTVVSQWVLCQLAMRPEYLDALREELGRVLEEDENGKLCLTARSLREARLMDSFIREVMRLKGDTLSNIRYTTCDVPSGTSPSREVRSFVIALATTVHENPDTFNDPREFKGFQWADTGKEAVMTGPAHVVFGLGRFACPGRLLAVNEIKLIVMSLIARSTPTLLEGKFEVSDPLNTVTQPPTGTLVFHPLEKSYLQDQVACAFL
ncbi:cytochrome P450 [Daedaleopsis nitida]|nr:cytochrome P450 [Daedaleopsis nitida]